jgi:hypothetical protein
MESWRNRFLEPRRFDLLVNAAALDDLRRHVAGTFYE